MKLRTRVLISVALIFSMALTSFGFIFINLVERDAKNRLASQMQTALNEINLLEDSPITSSFSVAANTDFELLVGMYDDKGELLSFSETEIQVKKLKKSDVKSALSKPIEISGKGSYLIRSIDLSNSSYVILASGLSDVHSSIATLTRQIAISILAFLLLSVFFVFAVMNKDLSALKKLSLEADLIANGELQGELTKYSGTSEVAVLSTSISAMASSLQKHTNEMQELLGDISHELKTPLTSIKGYAEILMQKYSDSEDNLRAFEIMQSEINHMTRLIDDILLMSKLGAINYEISDEINLGDLVRERFSILQELQPERPLHLVDECEEEVIVSQALMTRLIDNLVSNTLSHTKVHDSVDVFTFIEDGNWTLQYEDSGEGMPESYLVDFADELSRFDKRKSEGKGTGLGLSIVQQIVLQHGGTLVLGKSYLGGMLLRITAPISR